jgi:hypothetical protein
MLRDGYDTQARLASFDRPVVVAVAERDSLVPARFGVALHAALGGPKRLVMDAQVQRRQLVCVARAVPHMPRVAVEHDRRAADGPARLGDEAAKVLRGRPRPHVVARHALHRRP